MKLLGKDISTQALRRKVEARLFARGLLPSSEELSPSQRGPAPRVDPLSFNLAALEQHADSTRGLPLETHRQGLGQAVLGAKWLFRRTCQVFINEALGRQRLFNAQVYDAYAQLSAEVILLREEVARLKARPKKETSRRRRKA